MENIPRVDYPGSVLQQLVRERHLDREALSEALTLLKSLLRLDQDGVGNQEDLIEVLEKTRQAIDRFSCSVRRDMLADLDDAPGEPHAIHTFKYRPSELPDPFEFSSLEEDGCHGPSSESTRSSLHSSPSAVSTAATSVSPRDSILNRRFSVRLFASPSPCPGRARSSTFGFCGKEESALEEDEVDPEGEAEQESDASFQRLSLILASLQRQAEAAVLSPLIDEEEDGAPSQDSREAGGSEGNTKADVSPSSTITATQPLRIHKISAEVTPTPSRNNSVLSIPLSPLRKPSEEDNSTHLLPQPQPSPSRPQTPLQLLRRRSCVSKASEGENGEKELFDLDLDGLIADFLEERLSAQSGEYDLMFRWVWIYMVGGGFLWLVVGRILGWGHACGDCS